MTQQSSPTKHSQRIMKSTKKIYFPRVYLLFRKIPPKEYIYPAVEWAAQEMGITIAKFCMLAVEEKLKRDGFLLESE